MRPIKLLLAMIPLFLGIAACGSGDSAPGAAPSASEAPASASAEPEAGSLSLALQLASGAHINSVNYVVVGPHFTKSGALDVSNSATVSGVIGGIPIATGYTLTLNASGVGTPKAQCDGSTAFNIASAGVTTVPVHLTCHEADVVVAAAAPIPPFTILALGAILLGLGATLLRRDKARAA